MKAAIHVSHVEFESSGVLLQGSLFLPQGEGPWPAILLCHGFGSDRRVMRVTALDAARWGMAVLTFDFRGHGQSGGVYVGDPVDDVLAAIDHLAHLPRIDPQRIALVGHSMGARTVLQAAARDPRAKAVVSLACAPDLEGKTKEWMEHFAEELAKEGHALCHYPQFDRLPVANALQNRWMITSMQRNGFRLTIDWPRAVAAWGATGAKRAVREMSPRPLLFVHCRWDKLAPYQVSVELYELASPPKELFLERWGFHSSPYRWPQLRRRWLDWLLSVLGADGAARRVHGGHLLVWRASRVAPRRG